VESVPTSQLPFASQQPLQVAAQPSPSDAAPSSPWADPSSPLGPLPLLELPLLPDAAASDAAPSSPWLAALEGPASSPNPKPLRLGLPPHAKHPKMATMAVNTSTPLAGGSLATCIQYLRRCWKPVVGWCPNGGAIRQLDADCPLSAGIAGTGPANWAQAWSPKSGFRCVDGLSFTNCHTTVDASDARPVTAFVDTTQISGVP
jgi:hypothetical protein